MTRSKIASSSKLSFEHAFRPVYNFTRIFGLWPFSFIQDSHGSIQRTRIKFLDILRSILKIILDLTLIFITYRTLTQETYLNDAHLAMLNIYKISSLLTGIFGIAFHLIIRNELLGILVKFNTFENEVRGFFHIH